MSEPKKPTRPLDDPPPCAPALPVTESWQNADTDAGLLRDDDGVDVSQLLAPAQAEGELGRLGHFRILKKLGAGGMGMVLLAEDINLLRPVALKIMLPKYAKSLQAKERFLREARSAAKIHHDHVVTIYHVGEDRGIPYIAMEFLKGSALNDYLREKKGVSLASAMRIVREAAEGLQAAHAKGLIHRDIKPANIWLEAPKGRVKILDFGLARDASDEVKLTHSGTVIGTPAYMSPEQASGETTDPRTDLFSLGVLLYQLTTGRLPFVNPNMLAMLQAVRYEPHVSMAAINPQAPAGLVELVDYLLAKKPEDRPQSADEVARRLKELEMPASRDGKPIPEVVYVPMKTSVAPDPFADIDATESEMEVRAERRKPPGDVAMPLPGGLRRSARLDKKRPRWLIPTAIAAMAAVGALVVALLPGKTKPTDAEAKKDEPPKLAKYTKVETPQKEEPAPPPVVRGDEMTFDLGNGVKLDVIKINAKGKKLLMGSPMDEPGRPKSEPFDPEEQHEVAFGYDFYMGKYEVTQEQYQAIKGDNPSYFKDAKNPVDSVSWDDGQDFITKINAKFKDRKVIFRLPSEAEWEYACRAGTTTSHSSGKTLTSEEANFNGAASPKPVGSHKPNAFGLHDMHGNVYEWCEDYYGPYSAAPKDGKAQDIKSISGRILRGGAWFISADGCRSAYRNASAPERPMNFGFRLAATPPEAVEVKKEEPPPPPIVKGDEMTFDLGNGVKLEMVKINAKAKKFLMGSPKGEPERNLFEKKFDAEEQHEVTFGHDFYMGKYEVTQEQYQAIIGDNPSKSAKNPKHPVDSVSWNDAQDFMKKINVKFKDRKTTFRLPSEAEWEYACRAGTTTVYYTGILTKDDANFQGYSTKPVGTYKPNAFGLFDMHGNVYEWCQDYYGPYSVAPQDGKAQNIKQSDDRRVLRGGYWTNSARYCRSAHRNYNTPDIRDSIYGFRVVASPD